MRESAIRLALIVALVLGVAACSGSSGTGSDDVIEDDADSTLIDAADAGDVGEDRAADAPVNADRDLVADTDASSDATSDAGDRSEEVFDVELFDADTSGDADVASDASDVALGDPDVALPDADVDLVGDVVADVGADPSIDATDPDTLELDLTDADEPDAGVVDHRIRIVAANITSGNFQRYEGPGIRILQALDADIALMQEFSYETESDFAFNDFDAFIDGTFSDEHVYHRGPGNIPNGIVSRYPILESGTWDDETLGDREFEWARIDVPGPVDLWAVSVHLKASSSDAGQRSEQATALVGYIDANVPDGDYLVIGGDFNTYSRTESCVTTLSSVVETGSPWPVDTSGNDATNANRDHPYDWVLPDDNLGVFEVPVTVGDSSFATGLVVDTREYTPLSELAPAESGDSGVNGMQHMAVVRDFVLTGAP